jgi:uncharacterized protein DUF4230
MSIPQSASSPIHKAIAFFIIVVALICGAYFAFVHVPNATVDVVDKGGSKVYDLIKRIARDIDNVIHFKPQVTKDGETVIMETKPIAEFSLVQREFDQSYTWTHTWLGSTKSITMKARFIVKAGYDLAKPFSIDVSADQKIILTQMPPAKINSCAGSKYETIKQDNGWWNGVTKEERDSVINELNAKAEKSAIDNGVLEEAEKHLKTQIEEIIHKAAPSATIAPQPLA